MNKKGFTLVEVIVVISLLGLVVIISSTNILGGSTRAKEKMLQTKIENIEKAAVLYGQDNRNLISRKINDGETSYSLCFKNGSTTAIPNCYYYIKDGSTTITVGFLANPDGDDTTDDGYMNYDEGKIIKNPVDGTDISYDEIQIYEKYGKIYAKYIEK